MRRLSAFALVLACVLTLAACGGEEVPEGERPSGDSPSQDTGGGEVTVYDCGGLQVALPSEYVDQLRVDVEFPGAEESWKPLIAVYENASYEAAMQDFGGGGGFLFGLLTMDQAAFEQHISADGSGMEVFATDGEHYYAYTFPTDVQFYRSGGEIDTESEDWKTWEELNEIGPQVREDFLTRNNLQSFSARDFTDQLAAGDGNHVILRYYSYYLKDGDTRLYDTLLLRQPARQGEGGIWAVDQWMDEYGGQYLYFPDSGKPSAEYYADLQAACDAGERPELLTPAGAAANFVEEFFGHETAEDCFEEVSEVDRTYMEGNERLQQTVLDVMFGQEVEDLALLECVGGSSAENWGVLGRHLYGSDWFEPLMSAVADAAVGEGQHVRDKAVMNFLLETEDALTDFRTPLREVLEVQRQAAPEAFEAAVAEFSEEEQVRLSLGFASAKESGYRDVEVPTY